MKVLAFSLSSLLWVSQHPPTTYPLRDVYGPLMAGIWGIIEGSWGAGGLGSFDPRMFANQGLAGGGTLKP